MIRDLWRAKWALAVVAIVALLIALLTAYKLPSFQKRSLQFGAATSQILVDSPQSTLVAGAQDSTLATLATRAQVFAQYLSSPEAQAKISAASGVPASRLTASGPFSPEAQRANYDPQQPVQRAASISSEHAPNRLVFAAQKDVPIITVSAQSSTSSAQATKLANASFATLRAYVATLSRQTRGAPLRDANGQPFPGNGVTVRSLGAPEAGTIGGGNGKLLMIFAFIAVFGVGCVLILVLPALSRQWRLLDEIEKIGLVGQQLETAPEPDGKRRAERSPAPMDGNGDAAFDREKHPRPRARSKLRS